MKISNSKKQLAKIIHENGGWRDGAKFAWYGNLTKKGWFGLSKPWYVPKGKTLRILEKDDAGYFPCVKLPNWHQTVLSRDEYFHLYPVAETAPEPVAETKLTIEQLAADYRNAKDYADRKQQEADAAKADAEAKLVGLVSAGKALGLVLNVAEKEPELVITDWRDLRIGDVIECPDYAGAQFIGEIIDIDAGDGEQPIKLTHADGTCTWPSNWRFIRRPAKGETNA